MAAAGAAGFAAIGLFADLPREPVGDRCERFSAVGTAFAGY